MFDYQSALTVAIAAAREAGALLRQEFHRPDGPRGQAGHAPIDREAELLIRDRLLTAHGWRYLGEETGSAGDATSNHVWVVDPNDATASFLKGYRGSAVSIAALRDGVPILGVVFAYSYPDDDGDLIAWAEGCGPLQRNGRPITNDLSEADRGLYAPVMLARGSDRRAVACARAVAPSRFIGLPTVCYRLALVAVGEAVAAVAPYRPWSWDYAAGNALLRASHGILVDEQGQPPRYAADGSGAMSWCFAGAPPAVRALLARSWQPTIEAKPLEDHKPFGLARPRPGRTVSDAKRLSRIQGCWLGQLTGDALGGLVEFRDADDIARQYPHGVRELRDGGTWNTFAGQPTDDSELALMLARCLVEQGTYDTAAVRQAYVHWANSHPFDMGFTTSSALRRNQLNHESQANGSLMRVSPLGIVGARHPELAMEWARTDSGLTHPHPVCRDTCAVFVAALAAAIRGAEAKECHALALREARESAVREALTAAESAPPDDFMSQQGWVLIALHNAFYQLLHAVNFEEGVVATVMSGGDTDTNAAIAGALLGACHGREAIPPGWRRAVMCCRPLVESGSQQPRPMEFWPVDALILAESLAVCVPKVDFQSPQTR